METICENCHLGACDPRCPEAPEEKPIGQCCKCGCPIYEGAMVFKVDLDYFCDECANPQDLAEFYGWDGWEQMERNT